MTPAAGADALLPAPAERLAFWQGEMDIDVNPWVKIKWQGSLAHRGDREWSVRYAILDVAHALGYVLPDTVKAYAAAGPGAVLAWHNLGSPVPWIEVRRALEGTAFPKPVYHVVGTEVANLIKNRPDARPGTVAAGLGPRRGEPEPTRRFASPVAGHRRAAK